MALKIVLRQVVEAIASAVDLVGVDDVLHARRVGIMAVECAKQLQWDNRQINTLFEAALLHDCGVSNTQVRGNLVNELDWEGANAHCERGYNLLKGYRPLSHLAPILRYHHTHWNELQQLHLPDETALIANLIYLVDRVDITAAPHYSTNSLMDSVAGIRDLFAQHRGTFFAPEIMDAFLAASRGEAFWYLIEPDFIPHYLAEMNIRSEESLVGLEELKGFAHIIAQIVDAKSSYTTDHSLGVGRLTRFLAEKSGIQGERLDVLEISALLHDIGKLQIPDELLESTAKLSESERNRMKKHSFATYQILKNVEGVGDLALWAAQHHESLNGNGYPFRKSGGEIPLESRLIKVADVYQALAQNRPYRKSLPQEEILSILLVMQANNEIDSEIVATVAQNIDECHRIAYR
jgi:HD-GYP domain-containing protein (c-di-GMP phosphodiesterase class II)